MYNHIDAGQVAELELYDMTARLAIMYERILEYSEIQVSIECDRLHTINP